MKIRSKCPEAGNWACDLFASVNFTENQAHYELGKSPWDWKISLKLLKIDRWDRLTRIVILSNFAGTSGIFSSPRDSKLTRDGLGFQWNGQRKTFLTLTFELPGRNKAPLYFKTERVAETALRIS